MAKPDLDKDNKMDEMVSKSQKKREAESMQQLGLALTRLKPQELDAIPLAPDLKAAILQTHSIKSHGALRRHMQWIGKLMRREDGEAIASALDGVLAKNVSDTAHFHEIEIWRERLMGDEAATLTAFVEAYQPADLQLLRQYIKKAITERETGQPKGAMRALFRHLREVMQ